MTTKEWAAKLNGREYGKEITRPEAQQAKEDGIVIVYGASDDLMEFEGAISDEIGAYGRGEARVTQAGLFQECECDDYEKRKCSLLFEARKNTQKVEAIWTEDHPEFKEDAEGADWYIRTDIPHDSFMIMDEGSPYCRGIVFKLSDIGSAGNATVKESGEANCFTILGEDRNWLAAVQFNGELPVPTQRSLIRKMANAERMYDALEKGLEYIKSLPVETEYIPAVGYNLKSDVMPTVRVIEAMESALSLGRKE